MHISRRPEIALHHLQVLQRSAGPPAARDLDLQNLSFEPEVDACLFTMLIVWQILTGRLDRQACWCPKGNSKHHYPQRCIRLQPLVCLCEISALHALLKREVFKVQSAKIFDTVVLSIDVGCVCTGDACVIFSCALH